MFTFTTARTIFLCVFLKYRFDSFVHRPPRAFSNMECAKQCTVQMVLKHNQPEVGESCKYFCVLFGKPSCIHQFTRFCNTSSDQTNVELFDYSPLGISSISNVFCHDIFWHFETYEFVFRCANTMCKLTNHQSARISVGPNFEQLNGCSRRPSPITSEIFLPKHIATHPDVLHLVTAISACESRHLILIARGLICKGDTWNTVC